jgi:sulfoxide reductase catalytic subunit YedY
MTQRGTGANSRPDDEARLEAQRATSPGDGYRSRLQAGGDVVDVESWAGSLPEAYGVAPRVRVGRSRWFNLLWLLPIALLVLLVAVAVARGIRNTASVQDFISRYPGTVETDNVNQASGFPVWLAAQHFLNLFFMMFHHPVGLADPRGSPAALLDSP